MRKKREKQSYTKPLRRKEKKKNDTSPEKSKTKHKIKEKRNLTSKLYFNSNSLYKKALREKGYISQLKLYNLL